MRKNHSLFYFLLMLCLLNIGCTDENINVEDNTTNGVSNISTRSAFDDRFDLDNVKKLQVKNPLTNIISEVSLPWTNAAADSYGISRDWYDINAENANRIYKSSNGWYLVYSNLLHNDFRKYFAIYNKYTGQLRIFYFMHSSSANSGSSNSFWGIRVANATTSMFGFSSGIASDMSQLSDNPSFISSPELTFVSSDLNKVSKGYLYNNWYGTEIEIAYDNTLYSDNTVKYFDLGGWCDNISSITGKIETKGDITGKIISTSSGGSFNLSLSNLFNNTASSVITNNQGIINGIGGTLDTKIASGDQFSKNLWQNIQNNATKWISSGLQSGAKKGLEAIFSSGGSVVGESLGGLFNSLIGASSKENVSKVELQIATISEVKLTNATSIDGWGSVSQLPIPGTIADNQSSTPLYNKPLGVWNIKVTPKLICDVTHNRNQSTPKNDMTKFEIYFEKAPEIILNPIISSEYIVTDYKYYIIDNLNWAPYPGTPVLINGNAAYASETTLYKSTSYLSYPSVPSNTNYIIRFKLTNKKTGKIDYYFSKCFNAKITSGKETTIWQTPGGGDPIGPIIEM